MNSKSVTPAADASPLRIIKGEKRELKVGNAMSIGGAPVSYVAILAAVLTVTSFIPLSVSIGSGASFPLSTTIYPLIGIILGPVAGPAAAAIGGILSVIISPHTANSGILTPLAPISTAFIAGMLVQKKRGYWIIPLFMFFVGFFCYAGLGYVRGVSIRNILMLFFVPLLSVVLYLLTIVQHAKYWLVSKQRMANLIGFIVIFFTANISEIPITGAVNYIVMGWPNDVWPIIALTMPIERSIMLLAGTIIGMSVITGLRKLPIVKPLKAGY